MKHIKTFESQDLSIREVNGCKDCPFSDLDRGTDGEADYASCKLDRKVETGSGWYEKKLFTFVPGDCPLKKMGGKITVSLK